MDPLVTFFPVGLGNVISADEVPVPPIDPLGVLGGTPGNSHT